MSNQHRQYMTARWVSYFALFGFVMCSYSLAMATDLPDVMNAAERMDKMTTVGILSACLIVESIILGYMIHLVFSKFMETMAATNVALTRVVDAIDKCERNGR